MILSGADCGCSHGWVSVTIIKLTPDEIDIKHTLFVGSLYDKAFHLWNSSLPFQGKCEYFVVNWANGIIKCSVFWTENNWWFFYDYISILCYDDYYR